MADNLPSIPTAAASYEPCANPTVEAILKLRFPMLVFEEAVYALAKANRAVGQDLTPTLQDANALRAKLLALSSSDLKQAHEQHLARAESAMFFNQPSANADFGQWAGFDFWTLEESVALLLGKDPEQVDWKKLKGYAYNSKLPHTYEKLLKTAQRSDAMTATERLRPAEVLAWAQHSGAVEPPQELRRLVAARILPAAIPSGPDPDQAKGSLGGTQPSTAPVRWTKERLAALQAHRVEHGAKAAAMAFNISEQRLRKLLPKEPPKPKGNSAFNWRN